MDVFANYCLEIATEAKIISYNLGLLSKLGFVVKLEVSFILTIEKTILRTSRALMKKFLIVKIEVLR